MLSVKLNIGNEVAPVMVEIDQEDFYKITKYTWSVSGGSLSIISARVNGKSTTLGRYLLNYHGDLQVDHRDQDIYNNKKENLRIATRSQNQMNKGLQFNNTSGYKGVSWDKKNQCWKVQINITGKMKWVGRFDDIIVAAKAYDKAAKQHQKDFAFLNFPEVQKDAVA